MVVVMDNQFSAIRALAKERYHTAVAAARAEYRTVLRRIKSLENALAPKDHEPPADSIAHFVEQAMPEDRAFTLSDVMAGLEAIDSDREWPRYTVQKRLQKLCERGDIYLVQRPKSGKPSLYAREGVVVAQLPFQGMTLRQVIEATLTRPMNATEIAVALLEAGYDTAMSHRGLRHEIASILRNGPKRFRKNGNRWERLANVATKPD